MQNSGGNFEQHSTGKGYTPTNLGQTENQSNYGQNSQLPSYDSVVSEPNQSVTNYPKQEYYSAGDSYPKSNYPVSSNEKDLPHVYVAGTAASPVSPSQSDNPHVFASDSQNILSGVVHSNPPWGNNPNNVGMDESVFKDDDTFGFSDESIRKGFIRKVFGILMIQLIITFGFVALFVFHEPTAAWTRQNFFILYIAIAVSFIVLIAIVCFQSVCRTFPANIILLGIFTIAESLLLGFISSNYEPDAVILAVGITAVVCLALTLFAVQTKWDFTACGGVLLVALIVLILFGFIKIWLPGGKTLELVYASVGALIFGFYLIYDIQLILGGNHKYSISPEDYIFAALSLYLDIINLFLYILRIIGAARS